MPLHFLRLPLSALARPFAAFALVLGTTSTAGYVARAPRPLEPPPAVPREFRAAWATPIFDRGFRDWPSAPGLSPDSQRAELRAMLDRAVDAGLNAVILHVRLAGDAFYPTAYAPWSVFLTGKSGAAPQPAYDPLQFAVDEAHARGLQLHAWFNPFRAMLPQFKGKAAASHVTRKHPEWIRRYGSQTWIDPGEPAARAHVLGVMLDVVKRYDIDGIHIDDYFYPYKESQTVVRRVRGRRVRQRVDIAFPDEATWRKYGRAAGFTDRAAWRRANIDDFVRTLYREVKAIKPTTLVGISPFGIWRSNNPEGVRGLDAYSELYADSRRWLREGWLDYVAPQLYWPIDGEQDRFRALDAWWLSENTQGRHVWPGLYTSRVYGSSGTWPLGEIGRQIATLRDDRGGSVNLAGHDDRRGVVNQAGHVHFRLAALFANDGMLANNLHQLYADRALVPESPWLVSQAPAPPLVTVIPGIGAPQFSVAPGDSVRVRWWLIQTRDGNGQWSTSIRPSGEGQISASVFGTSDPSEVAITAIGMAGAASTPTLIVP